jgi:phosphosulfolactate phosphohydrolase-like enzyme
MKKNLIHSIGLCWPWNIPEEKFRFKGPAVVFDINAATYNIASLVGRAKELFLSTKAGVVAALDRLPHAVLIGEVDDPILKEKLKGVFVSSNNPISIDGVDIRGKQVILITNNGTETISEVLAAGAHPVYSGHYANFSSIVYHLRSKGASRVALVPSGGREAIYEGRRKLVEDLLCAQAMQRALGGLEVSPNDDFPLLREQIFGGFYSERNRIQVINHELQMDIFDVVPICERVDEALIRVAQAKQ